MVGLRRRLASARSLSDPRPPTPCTDTWAIPFPHDRGGAAAAASRTSPRLKLSAESAPYYAAATISANFFRHRTCERMFQKSPRRECRIEVRNNRIDGNGSVNQRCVSAPGLESMFLARRPKIFLQQHLPRAVEGLSQSPCRDAAVLAAGRLARNSGSGVTDAASRLRSQS